MQATNIAIMSNASQLLAQELRQAGLDQLGSGRDLVGALGPFEFFRVFQQSEVVLWKSQVIDGTTVFYQAPTAGADLLTAGGTPTLSGLRSGDWTTRVDFLSLMLALFLGTASLPHILIRYYTVKDAASARKSTVVGIAAIGFFYVLTLILGLGAMTSGALDPSDSNMAAPLLARSFGELPFAIISAIAFTTVLGTVSGLIMAASGAIVHDLAGRLLGRELDDAQKVRAGKIAAVAVGIIAMWLGVQFQAMNVTFLVGWAFNIAASANLPALLMLLFWLWLRLTGQSNEECKTCTVSLPRLRAECDRQFFSSGSGSKQLEAQWELEEMIAYIEPSDETNTSQDGYSSATGSQAPATGGPLQTPMTRPA